MFALKLQRNLTAHDHAHFWGKPTSSVDWCEVNYEVSAYVAEYFNTISSFAMALVGLAGVLLHPWAQYRFHTAFLTTVAECVMVMMVAAAKHQSRFERLVHTYFSRPARVIYLAESLSLSRTLGLGSVAFHGTLLKFSQALDEVPMLYSALSFVYIGICQRFDLSAATRRTLAGVLCVHAVVTTLLVTLSEGPYQFLLFHLSFGTAQIFAVFNAVQIYLERRARLARESAAGVMIEVKVTKSVEIGAGGRGKVAVSTGTQHGVSSRRARSASMTGLLSEGLMDEETHAHIERAAAPSTSSPSSGPAPPAGRDAVLWAFERGITLYLSAFVCWLLDMLLCEYVNPWYESTAVLPMNPQLHAWWHVLVSLGLYQMALLALAARVEATTGARATLGFWAGVVPFVIERDGMSVQGSAGDRGILGSKRGGYGATSPMATLSSFGRILNLPPD